MRDEVTLTSRGQQIRRHMHQHVGSRLNAVMVRYQGRTDAAARNAISAAQEKYTLESILAKGVKAAGSIAIASHIAKATHPDLKVKGVTHLAVGFSSLPVLEELGSHALPTNESLWDATGDGAHNNAAYELYLLLDSLFEGRSLAEWLTAGDEDAVNAFAVGGGIDGVPWLDLLHSKCPHPAISTLSKQIYWLREPGDACVDQAYQLLAPLFPASLAHQAYLQIHSDRYSEANNAARKAKREHKAHDGVFHDYPWLAVQKLGGTKPQNISQLNSERGGVNYLLASLPPAWKASEIRLPVHAESVFDRVFSARPGVQSTVRQLRKFLESNPEPNQETRQRREAHIETLLDELVSMASTLQQTMPAGWTRPDADDEGRFQQLARAEQLWLDPLRAELKDETDFAREWMWMDWPAEIGKRFAAWLNAQLENKLPVGDAEFREWKKVLLTDEDGFKQQLRELRSRLDAPHYIPIRKTHAELMAEREDTP